MSRTAWPVDDNADALPDPGDGRVHNLDMTSPFNYTSQCPVLSVPAGLGPDGLPVGLQIVARRYDDDLALRIGAALEDARPWAQLRPPV
jgi:Asp-tRNA(Asn)/Glu-tRNA(Gln) amidotransferase A subunit family amidase